VLRVKLAQKWQNKLLPERHRGGQPHKPANLARANTRVVRRCIELIHQLADTLEVDRPGFGQYQLPGGSVHQPCAQLGFQRCHGTGYLRGGEIQSPSRRSKTALAHDLDESSQMLCVHGKRSF
jgi:hypothetical protein